jgi:glycosyltransferase involved in cell wall biosynthesis
MSNEPKRLKIALLTLLKLDDQEAFPPYPDQRYTQRSIGGALRRMGKKLYDDLQPILARRASYNSWSGTICFMAKALEKYGADITYLGPIEYPLEELRGKIVHRSTQRLFKKNVMYHHGLRIAKYCSKVATERLAHQSFDVIFAPTGEAEIAFLETDIPIVLLGDATYGALCDYYPMFSNLTKRSRAELDQVESLALQKASLAIYDSQWAADSAINYYHAAPNKVHAIASGANFVQYPPPEIVQHRKKTGRCRLLFIGANWERKGGAIAFETLLKLEEMGIEAELLVCGSNPPPEFVHERMKILPFLNKANEVERKQFEDLFLTSDFLILPTRSECYGNVLCEANAYGLPAIATNTGGVPSIVREGENGFLLPLEARGEDYARVIARAYQDEQAYEALIKSSRAAFDERLNWDAWGQSMMKHIRQMLEDRQRVECARV